MATPGVNNNQATPISSRFPPTSATQLIKDRGAQKQRHTKLVNKIRAHIDQQGDASEVSQLRQKLSEVHEDIEAVHRKLIGAPDYKPDDDENGYIENVRKLSTDVRREMEQYVQLRQTTRQNEATKPKTRSSSAQTCGLNDRNENLTAHTSNDHPQPNGRSSGAGVQGSNAGQGSPAETETVSESVARTMQHMVQQSMQQSMKSLMDRFERIMESERQSRKDAEFVDRDLRETERRERETEHRRFMQEVEDRMARLERKLDNPVRGATSLIKESGAIPKTKNQFGIRSVCEDEIYYRAPGTETGYHHHHGTKQSTPTEKSEQDAKKKQTTSSSEHVNRWTLRRVCGDTSEHSDTSVSRRSIFRAPKIDISPFDGNPANWPDFVATFGSLIESDPSLTMTEKMGILRRCLTPDIRASLGDCMQDPSLFEDAIAELESTYGHPHVISRTYVRRIKELPKVNSIKDYDELLRFSIALRGAVTTLRSGGYEHELTAGLVDTVLDKLPIEIQSRWGEKIVDKFPDVLTMEDFEPWLHKLVQAQMVIRHGKHSSKPGVERKPGRLGAAKSETRSSPTILTTSIPTTIPVPATAPASTVKFVTPAADGSPKPKSAVCSVCKGTHRLSDCKEFASKSIDERANLVKTIGCCLRCLNRGHLMKECSSKRVCGVDGCKSRHHQLLHGAPRMFGGEAKETPTVAIGTATVKGPRPPTLLCIVPVTLKSGSGKSFDTYALIDNGAEATLITKKAAKQLGLSGPIDHMRLSSIHGQDPVVKTEEVGFSILPRNQSKTFKVTNALAIKKLMLSERKINWPVAKREWEHIADLNLPAINSNLVTVLLGRDTRGVHDTYATRRSEDDTAPEAVLTPFGWCIVGQIPTRVLDTPRTDISIHHVHPSVLSVEPVASAAPTTCIYALHRTAEDMRSAYPHVADLVKRNVYVDNLLHSTETEDEAIREARDFKTLCRHGGFNVVQWMSTSRKLLATIDPSELAQPIKNLERDPLPIERVLGMLLDCQTDEFIFKVSVNDVNTMRDVLQSISSIYDPLGLISAVILQARVILRECWRVKCTWDQPLPDSILDSWKHWSSNLDSLSQLRIPRCLRRPQKPILQEIHSFSDASEQGFGVCIYLRSVYGPDDVDIRLIIAKSRVAPLRQLSIPRLELQGALMASRLTDTVRTELNWKGAITFWCDSQTTLQWIHSSSCRFHAFVAHRVTEITDQFHPRQWRHVPGPLNPADDASRGISPTDLSSDHRWFQGPEFLRLPPDSWPSAVSFPEPDTDDPEVSATSWIGTFTPEPSHPLTDLARRSSSLPRFKRTVAWILRLKRKCSSPKDAPSLPRWLTAPEIQAAFIVALRTDQQQHFPREIATLRAGKLLPPESPLYELSPYFDDSGLLRVSGRLEHAPIAEDTKHPIIIHFQSHLARLLVIDTHSTLAHSSVERTISYLRTHFYILRVRKVVRSIVGHCFECKRRNAQPAPPIMAPLPANRLKPFNPPFTCTGIDYFGPLEVTMFRRTVKRYGVLFTCMTTRAVHLEIAHSLDTDSFLMAFWRFVNRRGCPSTVYSDNGTNLTAGERILRESIERLDAEKIADQTSAKGIDWKFSPPAAPHFGGVWERIVRSAKLALRIVLRNRTVNDEVLYSALVGVEALLNDRPLTHVSVDPRDLEALTPNHFLLGRANPNRPPDVILSTETLSPKSWRLAQLIVTQFWHRWLREYIPDLIERRIWLKPRRNLSPGDIVLVVDPATRRGDWPIGRVLQVYPGPDGVVRSASVKTAHGITHRPSVKLCLLEADSSEDVSAGNRAGYVADDAPIDPGLSTSTPAP